MGLKLPVYMRKQGRIKSLDNYADRILSDCGRIFHASADLDTAVRDTVAEGLAHLVYSAYDSRACSLGLESEEFSSFIANSTAEWFRFRDYSEWFCLGAGQLFNSSRPRIKAEMDRMIVIRKSGKRKTRAKK
jgi:hypothetical protein